MRGEGLRRAVTALATGLLAATAVAAASPGGAAAPREARDAPSGSSVAPCPQWPMYGRSPARTFSTDCPSAIAAPTVSGLVPLWTFDTPRTVTASPVVAGGAVFVGDWSGTMYALDAATGELRWRHATAPAPGAAFGPIVSSAAVADLGERTVVVFGSGPRVYALDAADGSEVWVRDLGTGRPDDPTEVESSPVVWDGVVYVGSDVHNAPVAEAANRGAVHALDAATGATIWRFNAELDRGPGGCSSYWSSPTLDVERGLVFAASGNCPHDHEWTPYVEAVTALDARTGRPVWSFQPHEPNRRDWDFGATPNLFVRPDGTHVLGAGNKDGRYYALDPATGRLLWQTRAAEPGDVQRDFSVGGFIGSPAVWRGDVFGATALSPPPSQHAIGGRDGSILWQSPLAPSYAGSAAVQGVVFTGGLDAQLRAFDARSGEVRWQVPLAGPVSSAPAVVGDRLYVGSGTSSSDLCAKDTPVFSDACMLAFDQALGAAGAVHAFELRAPGHRAATAGTSSDRILLGAEGNRLHGFDLDTLERQVVIASAADDPEDGLDINAQICPFPDGSGRFVAGEDTSQPDPPPAWGIFRLDGGEVGALGATQLGELRPTYQGGADGAENYGCGFLADGRILTTDVGRQFPGEPATGQLIVWFPPFDSSEVAYCKIDVGIATAGGIHVAPDDTVLVASNRPDEADGEPGGVWRYRGDWPTGPDAAGGCGRTDATGAPLVDAGRVTKELFIPADAHALTPSAVAASGRGTYYVSSVYNGVIAEYDVDGRFVRRVLDPPGPPAQTTGTPFGIVTDADGTLYYADLGIVGTGPRTAHGSVRRIRFGADGAPLPPETLAAGLDFPDGVGFAPRPRRAARASGHTGAVTGAEGGDAPLATSGAPLPATGAPPLPALGAAGVVVAVITRRSARRGRCAR